MSNTWGEGIKLSIFGESHGPAIGIIIGGLPPGEEIDLAEIEREMRRRAPGFNETATSRKESDTVNILSGLFNGKTTGAPLCGSIDNNDTRSRDYSTVLRPGHADMTAFYKYKGYSDFRGGGHFSGRLTAPLVFAGGIAKQILLRQGITIGARIASVGDISETASENMSASVLHELSYKEIPVIDDIKGNEIKRAILTAKEDKDSLGGVIEAVADGLPVGLGDPFFDSMESVISSMMFSIPAVKGVEFGDGFKLATMRGSECNDEFYLDESRIKTYTNSNGGILGGITNGMQLVVRVCVKPTPSIGKPQHMVDRSTMENVTASVKGRHDPCIVPRAVPVVEAGLAVCILDRLILSGFYKGDSLA